MYQIYGHSVKYECLIKPNEQRKGCGITDCPRNKKYKLKQPKDVALLAVLREGSQQIWISSFTNCCQCINDGEGGKKKKHAEEFLLEDAAADNQNSLGSVLNGFQPEDGKSRALTLYITYQPCHESAENSMQKSCTETVIKLYKETLKPKGIKLIIKPTHILKAYWNINQKQRMCKKETQTAKEVQNAKRGMKKLADLQIAEDEKFSVEAMTEDDWQFLADIFNVQLIHNYDRAGATKDYNYAESERKKFDDFINGIVEGILQEAQE